MARCRRCPCAHTLREAHLRGEPDVAPPLRSIEDLFGLTHLGYAADPAVPAFDKAVYNATGATSGHSARAASRYRASRRP